MSRTKSLGAHSTMNNPNDYLVGLDIGSHKVLCVVALPSPKGEGSTASAATASGIRTAFETAS